MDSRIDPTNEPGRRGWSAPSSRRTLLKGAGLAGAAVLGGGLLRSTNAGASANTPFPIKHVVVACQENRSFDHYYGFAPFAGSFGPPTGYSQPDGNGDFVQPFHFTSLSTPDIGHSWDAMHAEYDSGAMDGFYTTNGINCLGYYTAEELPFYYSLFDSSTLCANYFCPVMGPTYPNRFYLVAGTSGGITTNGIWGYGVFDYPIILDLLDAAGVSWGVYNMNWDSVPFGNTDNVFVFWQKFAHDQRTRGSKGSFLNDARKGALPQVSWLVSSFAHHKDEHPPADVSVGMGLQQELITAVRESPLWQNSAYLLTYDEHGGFFDHVAPPQIDAFGLSVRVPLWVVSPWAKTGPAKSALPAEHSSTLKLIEALHGLPTLSSLNHQFDSATPTGSNYQANGAPAPPRDGRSDISDLLDMFTF